MFRDHPHLWILKMATNIKHVEHYDINITCVRLKQTTCETARHGKGHKNLAGAARSLNTALAICTAKHGHLSY